MEIDIERIKQVDPSKSKKYTKWIIKQLRENVNEENLYNRVIDVVQEFDRVGSNLQTPDIYQWGLLGLEASLKERTSRKKERDKIKAHKVFKNERYELIRIDNWEAAIYYGKGTKWCISTEKYSAYEDNTKEGKVYYFLIDKDPGKDLTPEGRVCFELDWNYATDLIFVDNPDYELVQRLRQHATTYNSRDHIVSYNSEKLPGKKLKFKEKGYHSKYRFLGQFLETAILDLINLENHPNISFRVMDRYHKDKVFTKLDNILHGLTVDERIEGVYALLSEEELRLPIMRGIMKSDYLLRALEMFDSDHIVNWLEKNNILRGLLFNTPSGDLVLNQIIQLVWRKYGYEWSG